MKPDAGYRSRWIYPVFVLTVFVFLLVFFCAYRPVVLDNMDDWTYITFTRRAVPLWKYWNPTRVFPEIFMPVCAQLGVWLIYPFTGDYVWSVSVALNLALCVFAALYFACLCKTLHERTGAGMSVSVMISTLFLVLHFKSWMSPWIPGRHVFYTGCATTAFYYTIPALLNALLVMTLDMSPEAERFADGKNPVRNGCFVVLLYLGIFSNLFSSCILAVYALWRLVCLASQALRRRMSVRECLKKGALLIGVLAAWLVSVVYEVAGGRAANLKSEASYWTRIKETVHVLLNTIEQMDDAVFFLCAGLIAAGVLLLIIGRCAQQEDRAYAFALLQHLTCAALTGVFLILLCAATASGYIDRMDVLIGAVFHVMLAAAYSLAYVIRKWKVAALAVPLVIFVFAFDVLMGIETFAHSTTNGQHAKTTLAVNRAFMQQILGADQAGMTEMTMKVPVCDSADNFPYAYAMGGRMITALSNHGMINRLEVIHIEPAEGFYAEFGIE